MTYTVKRGFSDETKESRILLEDVTLEEAEAWCNDEIASSKYYDDRTNPEGPGVVWFDKYVVSGEEDE